MPWIQRGVIFTPDSSKEWSRTHAQAPSAIELEHGIRIYYGTRDAHNRSRTSFVDVDRNDPTRILYIHDRPVMDLGKPGTHDEDGVIASQILRVDDELWMYYGGVSKGGSVPYRMSIGLARSRDGGTGVVDMRRSTPFSRYVPSTGGITLSASIATEKAMTIGT